MDEGEVNGRSNCALTYDALKHPIMGFLGKDSNRILAGYKYPLY